MTTSVADAERALFFTLLQLIVILLGARAAGEAARRLGQPRVVGEIVAGLILGRSLFGRLFPDLFDRVFQSSSPEPLHILSQIGLVLLMCQIGLEFDFSHLRDPRNRKSGIAVSVTGVALPLALGWLIGAWSHPHLAPAINPLGYRLFLAVALAITAIPILGRIMMEFGLTRTRIGVIAITAAAIDDITGWTLLAAITALTAASFSPGPFSWRIALLVAYVGVCWVLARPLLLRLNHRFGLTAERLPQGLLAILLGVVFLSGLITYRLGVFAIFGGFVIGVLLHDQPLFVAAWRRSVGDFVFVFFLPIFFTFTGLRTNVNALDSWALWGWCLIIIAAATLGKFGGCTLAARLTGLGWLESGSVGVMMNTRALMELIVVNAGYELGVIPPTVFTMLVLMAVVSTVVTSPLLRVLLKRMGHEIPAHREA